MWETWVWSLGWEDSPGEGNGYPLQYSGLENSWTEEPGRLQFMGSQSLEMTEWLSSFTLLFHFHQKALCSSSLSAIRVVPSAYLRLLIFLPAILIPAVLHPVKVKEENEKAGLKLSIQKIKIMTSGPITSWQIDGEAMETMTDFILGGFKITADGDCRHEIKRRLLLGIKVIINLDINFADKDPSSQSYGFSSSHLWTWELDHKESWTLKNWRFWTVVLGNTLESPLVSKSSQT